jgi:nicotinamidase-related amidase
MKSILGLSMVMILCSLASAGELEAGTTEDPVPQFDGAALIVIDIQAFYFPGGAVPLVRPEPAAKRAAEVIGAFRSAGRPVIHIQHLPKGVDTPDPTGITEQYRIHPDVLPIDDEIVIGKHHANSFRDTELLEVVRELGVEKLVVVGMQTHMCVEAATRAAADFGFEVTVVHDACATRDLEFDGDVIPAAQVHGAALAAMDGSYAEVVSAAELMGSGK